MHRRPRYYEEEDRGARSRGGHDGGRYWSPSGDGDARERARHRHSSRRPASSPSPTSPARPSTRHGRDRRSAAGSRSHRSQRRRQQRPAASAGGLPRRMPVPFAMPTGSDSTGRAAAGAAKALTAASLLRTQKHVADMWRYFKVFLRHEHRRRSRAALRVQSVFRGYAARSRMGGRRSHLHARYPTASDLAAPPRAVPLPQPREWQSRVVLAGVVAMQALFRGYRARVAVALLRMHSAAAVRVQATWRGWRVRRRRMAAAGPLALLNEAKQLRAELAASQHARAVQDRALRVLWEEVRTLRAWQEAQEADKRRQAASRILRVWHAFRRDRAVRRLQAAARGWLLRRHAGKLAGSVAVADGEGVKPDGEGEAAAAAAAAAVATAEATVATSSSVASSREARIAALRLRLQQLEGEQRRSLGTSARAGGSSAMSASAASTGRIVVGSTVDSRRRPSIPAVHVAPEEMKPTVTASFAGGSLPPSVTTPARAREAEQADSGAPSTAVSAAGRPRSGTVRRSSAVSSTSADGKLSISGHSGRAGGASTGGMLGLSVMSVSPAGARRRSGSDAVSSSRTGAAGGSSGGARGTADWEAVSTCLQALRQLGAKAVADGEDGDGSGAHADSSSSSSVKLMGELSRLQSLLAGCLPGGDGSSRMRRLSRSRSPVPSAGRRRRAGRSIACQTDAVCDAEEAFVRAGKDMALVVKSVPSIGLVMRRLASMLAGERAAFFTCNADASQLQQLPVYSSELFEKYKPVAVGTGLLAEAIALRAPMIVNNVRHHRRFDGGVDRARGTGDVASMLVVPVLSEEVADKDAPHIVGLAVLYNKGTVTAHGRRPLSFTEEDSELMHGVLRRLGLSCVQNDLALRRLKEQESQFTHMTKKLLVLQDVFRELAGSHDLEAVMHDAVQRAMNLIACDQATVFLLDRSTGELYTRFSTNKLLHDREIRIPATSGVAGACFKSQSMLNIPDAYEHPAFNSSVDSLTGYRTLSILCCPLFDSSGDCMGLVQLINKQHPKIPGTFVAFAEEDEQLVSIFAEVAEVAIQKAKWMDRTKLAIEEESIAIRQNHCLLMLARAMSTSSDSGSLLAAVQDELLRVTHAQHLTLFLPSPTKEGMLFTQTARDEPVMLMGSELGLAGRAFHRGVLEIVDDSAVEAMLHAPVEARWPGTVVRSVLTSPLASRDGQVLGVLQLTNKLPSRRPSKLELAMAAPAVAKILAGSDDGDSSGGDGDSDGRASPPKHPTFTKEDSEFIVSVSSLLTLFLENSALQGQTSHGIF
eukprot:PLAT2542.6.p1 GENE.PLAT2542.6~~PLAT2542.6.p1  ORF type:complete len:1384 (-),score=589.62 PLAT2542.6:82-3897(-)